MVTKLHSFYNIKLMVWVKMLCERVENGNWVGNVKMENFRAGAGRCIRVGRMYQREQSIGIMAVVWTSSAPEGVVAAKVSSASEDGCLRE